jgi:deoxyribodipyrimidine photolyase
MQRAQRAIDNPALTVAIRAANELGKPVLVFFCLLSRHPTANLRHYAFMVQGLEDTSARLERMRIGFVLRTSGGPSPLPVRARFPRSCGFAGKSGQRWLLPTRIRSGNQMAGALPPPAL